MAAALLLDSMSRASSLNYVRLGGPEPAGRDAGQAFGLSGQEGYRPLSSLLDGVELRSARFDEVGRAGLVLLEPRVGEQRRPEPFPRGQALHFHLLEDGVEWAAQV